MPGCGAKHPDDQSRTCMVRGKHADHMDIHGTWTDPETEQRIALVREQRRGGGRKGTRKRVNALAASAIAGRRETIETQTGIPAPAVEKWSSGPWVAYAEQVFVDYLKTHDGQFTTAEHIWPLLDAPEEMRAMSVVTQRMLRGGLMEEAGATRLKGVYRTKDGVEFAENKLVPIYRSRIASSGRMAGMGEDPPPHSRDDTSISDTPASEGLGRPGASEVGVSPTRIWGPQ